uniref:Uncharacterized protein n=2 Tax=Brassica campestris TaxID=3711 RepID=M4F0F0_BRACM
MCSQGAPHHPSLLMSETWNKPYSREYAAFSAPMALLRQVLCALSSQMKNKSPKQPRDRDGDRKLGRERGRKTSNLKFVDTETFPERLLLCPSPYPTILDVPGSPHTYWGRFLCVPETSPSPRRTRYVRRHQVGVPVQPSKSQLQCLLDLH